jgi:hypothetical protein
MSVVYAFVHAMHLKHTSRINPKVKFKNLAQLIR